MNGGKINRITRQLGCSGDVSIHIPTINQAKDRMNYCHHVSNTLIKSISQYL